MLSHCYVFIRLCFSRTEQNSKTGRLHCFFTSVAPGFASLVQYLWIRWTRQLRCSFCGAPTLFHKRFLVLDQQSVGAALEPVFLNVNTIIKDNTKLHRHASLAKSVENRHARRCEILMWELEGKKA